MSSAAPAVAPRPVLASKQSPPLPSSPPVVLPPVHSPPLPGRPTRAVSSSEHVDSTASSSPGTLSLSRVNSSSSAASSTQATPSQIAATGRRPSAASTLPNLSSTSSAPADAPSSSPSLSYSSTTSPAPNHPPFEPLSLPHSAVPPERRASAPMRSSPSASPPHPPHEQHNRSASSTAAAHFSFKGYFSKLRHSTHPQQPSQPLPAPTPLSPRSSSIPFHLLLQHHRQYATFLATLEAELHVYGASMAQAHDSMRRLGATLHSMYRTKAVEDANKRRPLTRATSAAKLASAAAANGSTLSWLSASFASHTMQAVHIFDSAIQQRLELLIVPGLQQKRRDSAHIDALIAADAQNWQRYQHYSTKVNDLETTKERDRRDNREHADRERYERNHAKLEASRAAYQRGHNALLRELATSFEMRFSFLDSLLLELVKAEQLYHTGLHGQLLPIIVKVKEMIKGERMAAIEAREEKGGGSDNEEEENTVMMGTARPTLDGDGFGSLHLSLPTVSSSSLHAHYQLITKIGAGTYGETVLCTDSADESVWIMKRLQCASVRHVNRAMHEAMMMSAVKQCQYVCRVREVFVEEWSGGAGQADRGVGEETGDAVVAEGKEDVHYEGETDGGGEGAAKAGVLCTVCIVMEYGIGGDLQRRISIELSRRRQQLLALAASPEPSSSPHPIHHASPPPAADGSASPGRHERSVSYSFNSVSSGRYMSTDEELPPAALPTVPTAGFSAARVTSWMYQLCSGLASLHSALLLHRDIKPENLFLTSSDSLLLGDYGIMRLLASSTATTRTHIGTPAYMAPECVGREGYGLSADVWSAGCVLYELCTLQPPAFSFRSMDAVAAQVRERGYGEELVGVMRRMLSVVAGERPTAAECAEAFRRMKGAELHHKEQAARADV